MYCKKCGAKLKDNAAFCEKCGNEDIFSVPQKQNKTNWIQRLKSEENWGYKVMGFAVFILLIIASYTKFAYGGEGTYRVCMIWPVHIAFVVTSWINIVNAIINIDKASICWKKIKNALILRTVPIFTTWIVLRLFMASTDMTYDVYCGYPIFAALCGLAAILINSGIVKKYNENGMIDWKYIQKTKTFSIISLVNILSAVICALSGFMSFASEGKEGFLLLHIGEYEVLQMMAPWGFVLIVLGVLVVCLSSYPSLKTSIVSSIISLVMFIINMIVINNDIIVAGFLLEEIVKASGYYFMIIGPILCFAASLIKALYIHKAQIKLLQKTEGK